MTLDDTFSSRDLINAQLKDKTQLDAERWGITITHVEIMNILPPNDIKNVMEEQIREERERRSTVINADGNRESSIVRAQVSFVVFVRRPARAVVVAIRFLCCSCRCLVSSCLLLCCLYIDRFLFFGWVLTRFLSSNSGSTSENRAASRRSQDDRNSERQRPSRSAARIVLLFRFGLFRFTPFVTCICLGATVGCSCRKYYFSM
jgi:hypothetical protein